MSKNSILFIADLLPTDVPAASDLSVEELTSNHNQGLGARNTIFKVTDPKKGVLGEEVLYERFNGSGLNQQDDSFTVWGAEGSDFPRISIETSWAQSPDALAARVAILAREVKEAVAA